MIVDVCISQFRFLNSSLTILKALMLCTYIFRTVIFSWWIDCLLWCNILLCTWWYSNYTNFCLSLHDICFPDTFTFILFVSVRQKKIWVLLFYSCWQLLPFGECLVHLPLIQSSSNCFSFLFFLFPFKYIFLLNNNFFWLFKYI